MVKKTFKFENRHVAYEQQVISNIMPDMQRFSEKFKKHTEYAKKETHTEFVKYLNDTIDFDLANGLDLVSNDGSTKWFDFSEAQNDLIFYYDLISIGGRIMMDAFDIEQYARIEGGSNAAVNTANITSYILSELAKIKHEIATAGEQAYVTPYGVNCVLASMIEHELKLHVSRKYILTVLKNVKTALDNNDIETLRNKIGELERAAEMMASMQSGKTQSGAETQEGNQTADDVVDADSKMKN